MTIHNNNDRELMTTETKSKHMYSIKNSTSY
jgi:hypothetical protein